MSRLAKKPLEIPTAVELKQERQTITVKGPKGQMDFQVSDLVKVSIEDKKLMIEPATKNPAAAMLGTTVIMIKNMFNGVINGFEKKLQLIGVGYRAKAQGNNLELSLGFSHPVLFAIPDGIVITTPSNTEILIQGIDKQKVGQVAANIREYRLPEVYKGKGIRYSNERIVLKETKKK